MLRSDDQCGRRNRPRRLGEIRMRPRLERFQRRRALGLCSRRTESARESLRRARLRTCVKANFRAAIGSPAVAFRYASPLESTRRRLPEPVRSTPDRARVAARRRRGAAPPSRPSNARRGPRARFPRASISSRRSVRITFQRLYGPVAARDSPLPRKSTDTVRAGVRALRRSLPKLRSRRPASRE